MLFIQLETIDSEIIRVNQKRIDFYYETENKKTIISINNQKLKVKESVEHIDEILICADF